MLKNPARDLGYCCACGNLLLTGAPRAVVGQRIACPTDACRSLAEVSAGWSLTALEARELLAADAARLQVGQRPHQAVGDQLAQHVAP